MTTYTQGDSPGFLINVTWFLLLYNNGGKQQCKNDDHIDPYGGMIRAKDMQTDWQAGCIQFAAEMV